MHIIDKASLAAKKYGPQSNKKYGKKYLIIELNYLFQHKKKAQVINQLNIINKIRKRLILKENKYPGSEICWKRSRKE